MNAACQPTVIRAISSPGMAEPSQRWCILRTSASATIPLASSLTGAGLEVWTPRGQATERSGPSRSRREVVTALIPGFVFALSDHLPQLLAMSHSPARMCLFWDAEKRRMMAKGMPYFSVFRGGNHRLIPDEELVFLRRAEHRVRPKKIEHVFALGDPVRTDDGGFAGLVGRVVGIRGKLIAVRFPKWDIVPEFGAWLLRPHLDAIAAEAVNGGGIRQAQCAKAA